MLPVPLTIVCAVSCRLLTTTDPAKPAVPPAPSARLITPISPAFCVPIVTSDAVISVSVSTDCTVLSALYTLTAPAKPAVPPTPPATTVELTSSSRTALLVSDESNEIVDPVMELSTVLLAVYVVTLAPTPTVPPIPSPPATKTVSFALPSSARSAAITETVSNP